MKRLTLFYIFLLWAAAALTAQPKYEVRAVWLTTIGGIDWPSTYAHDGMGISAQQRQLCQMLDQLQAAGVNTVLLQTRVRATTIYPSDLEPWDGCMSGKPGRSPGYDPLQFAIDECHRRGMELHAWVVTLPVGKWNTYGCQQLRRRYPSLIKRIGEEGYMTPESPLTADYIAGICEEITRRYDVDGIHLDYIRYPETWKLTVGRAAARDNITRIVSRIRQRVKLYKPWVKLSCSPVGKFDDLSRYRSGGWNAYYRVCQDAQGWLRDGLMDQLYPMLYFKANQFYPFAIDWQEHSYGRTVAAGMAVYMLSPSEGRWPLSEIQRQLNVTRQIGQGHCYFRARFLLDNIKGVYDYVCDFDRQPALVPPMTWAGQPSPTPPAQLSVRRTAEGDQLSWSGATDRSDGPYLLYNVYASTEPVVDISNPANLVAVRRPWTTLTMRRQAHRQPLYYAVTAVDRYGQESAACQEFDPSLPAAAASRGVAALPLISTDGQTLTVPHRHGALDATHLVVCSPVGTVVRTFPYAQQLSVSTLPDGFYELRSLNRKGISHRLGHFIIKR